MEDTNQGGNKKIYVAIIVLLLLINGVALYLLWKENSAKNVLVEDKAKLETNVKSLTDTLSSKQAELQAFMGKNAELDSVITAQIAEIEAQKKKIETLQRSGNFNANELKKVRDKVSQYEASIAELQKKVDELTQKNQQLTSENTQLSSDLTNEKKTTSELAQKNEGLSKKVELGSLLHLQKITVEAIRKKGNGKEVVVTKGKQAESLKISFETGENKVLEPGNLSLYVRVLNPKGETISVADQGSGSMQTAGSKENIQYTKKADFEWDQTNKKIVVYWSQNIQTPGTYKVEIYQSGYQVGAGAVTLK